jgi:predicted nucleic acid-binding protein
MKRKMTMNKAAVYDTRFFIELYNSKDELTKKKASREKQRKKRYVSTVVVHELYNNSLSKEGRETARLKVAFLKKEFEIIPVDDQVAEVSAELRHKYHLSMGDSMIAATASVLKATCITDDPHFKQIKEIETSWI